MNDIATKTALAGLLFDRLGNEVMSGPFAGMQINQRTFWPDQNITAKLIGCYEAMLHPVIERAIARLAEHPHPTVVNVGCAEGFYAIGLARRLPRAQIVVSDTDQRSIQLCLRNAEDNHVAERIREYGQHIPAKVHLVVMDCEGSETTYLSESACAQLAYSDIIVECHDFFDVDRPISQELIRRLEPTHEVERIDYSENIKIGPYQFLSSLSSQQQITAMMELRPQPTVWLAAWSRRVCP